jgi:hypothetical protein
MRSSSSQAALLLLGLACGGAEQPLFSGGPGAPDELVQGQDQGQEPRASETTIVQKAEPRADDGTAITPATGGAPALPDPFDAGSAPLPPGDAKPQAPGDGKPPRGVARPPAPDAAPVPGDAGPRTLSPSRPLPGM